MGRNQPQSGKAGDGDVQDPRKARLAAALRENLKRRKAQARGKAAEAESKDGAAD